MLLVSRSKYRVISKVANYETEDLYRVSQISDRFLYKIFKIIEDLYTYIIFGMSENYPT